MARAARGVLSSESVVLISISSLKMSRANWRSASARPVWAAVERVGAHTTRAAPQAPTSSRLMDRMPRI